MKLNKTVMIRGTLEVVTGLHIGGSVESIEIGGIDNHIIKHPVTQEPYIPGSSLKGKMRSQMEKKEGKIGNNGEPCGCGQCMVCRVFGPHKKPEHLLGPTRILVRDALLSEESREEMRKAAQDGKAYIEIKTENIINRNIGTARDPRQQERVPAGAKFDLEIGVQVMDLDSDHDVVGYVKEALKSVEESYIGGSGSRGYGKVRFIEMNLDGDSLEL
jgi:CRISPR-associated protein Csm3